jgi:hypothetical protein
MSPEFTTSLENCFGGLPDPRVSGRCDHKLLDIIIIAVCSVPCGADSWVELKRLVRRKQSWFRTAMDNAFLFRLLTQI